MLRFALLAVALGACFANPQIQDCRPGGSDVTIRDFKVVPYPPRIPGTIRISLDTEVVKETTNFDVNITLIKDMNGYPVKIPCFGTIGSCYYEDVCSILDDLFPDDSSCPPVVTQCRCPFMKNKLQVRDLPLKMPALPPSIAPIIDGKYEVFMSLQDNSDKSLLSCLNVKLEIRAGLMYFVY